MKTSKNAYFLFTCDVEYAGPNTAEGVMAFMEMLDNFNIQGTFFVTYRILKEYTDIVHQISKNGHEVASHGYSHPFNENNFRYLTSLSKEEIETEIALSFQKFGDFGFEVKGYRAPALKTNDYAVECEKKWFHYDSSYTSFGMRKKIFIEPNDISAENNNFIYIPVSNISIFKMRFGSPYLLQTGSFIRNILRRFINQTNIIVFYCHGYELITLPHELLSTRGFLKRTVYHKHCGSKRLFDFHSTLLSTAREAGCRFVTCSQLCDIIETSEVPIL